LAQVFVYTSGSWCRQHGNQDISSRFPNIGERRVIGVQWHTSLAGVYCEDTVRLVNIDTFGTKLSNPLDSTVNIEVYPRVENREAGVS